MGCAYGSTTVERAGFQLKSGRRRREKVRRGRGESAERRRRTAALPSPCRPFPSPSSSKVSLLLLYTSVCHLPPTTHQPRGPERPRRPTTSPRRRRAFCNLARAARGAVGRVQGCSRAAYEHERDLCGSRATCAARAASRADSRLSLALDHLDLDDPITLTCTPRSLADPLPPTAHRMSAPAPSGERGGFGRGRGGDRRGPRRGPRRGARKDEEKEWCVPLSPSTPPLPEHVLTHPLALAGFPSPSLGVS